MDLQYTLGVHKLIHSNITGTVHSHPLNEIKSCEHCHLGFRKIARRQNHTHNPLEATSSESNKALILKIKDKCSHMLHLLNWKNKKSTHQGECHVQRIEVPWWSVAFNYLMEKIRSKKSKTEVCLKIPCPGALLCWLPFICYNQVATIWAVSFMFRYVLSLLFFCLSWGLLAFLFQQWNQDSTATGHFPIRTYRNATNIIHIGQLVHQMPIALPT